MRIEITAVETKDGTTRVAFRCACGEAHGRWHGAAPAVGDVRVVELDGEAGVSATARIGREASVSGRDGRIEITACVLERHDTGTVLVGFADGRLVVDAPQGANWRVGHWYTIVVTDLVLFDANV